MEAPANAGLMIKDGSFERSTYVPLIHSLMWPPKDESLPFHDDRQGYLKLVETLQPIPLAQVLQVSLPQGSFSDLEISAPLLLRRIYNFRKRHFAPWRPFLTPIPEGMRRKSTCSGALLRCATDLGCPETMIHLAISGGSLLDAATRHGLRS